MAGISLSFSSRPDRAKAGQSPDQLRHGAARAAVGGCSRPRKEINKWKSRLQRPRKLSPDLMHSLHSHRFFSGCKTV